MSFIAACKTRLVSWICSIVCRLSFTWFLIFCFHLIHVLVRLLHDASRRGKRVKSAKNERLERWKVVKNLRLTTSMRFSKVNQCEDSNQLIIKSRNWFPSSNFNFIAFEVNYTGNIVAISRLFNTLDEGFGRMKSEKKIELCSYKRCRISRVVQKLNLDISWQSQSDFKLSVFKIRTRKFCSLQVLRQMQSTLTVRFSSFSTADYIARLNFSLAIRKRHNTDEWNL